MIYKEYGKTGKKVSAVGFGGMRFDISKSKEENAELLRYANAKGINYFDTAPYYCKDQSEDIFGIAFKNMPKDFYVSTKGTPKEFNTAKKAKEAVKKSLNRLGLPKIHFYHIWNLLKMEHYKLAMKSGGQYEGLLECKKEGLIDHIVFSSHQPGSEIKHILEDGKMEGVLLGINILNFPYRWDGVMAAYKRGYGVVAMNPLFGGAIPTHEKELSFLASKGETPTEAALRFLISCPQVSVVLNGFTTRKHVDMACRVADEALPFTDADLEKIRKQIGKNMNSACTGCGYCDKCPQNIPVPSYMQLYKKSAKGQPIKAFVNIGGATPNYGNTNASITYPNGLVIDGPKIPDHPERGLIFEYQNLGIPIIHLLNIRGLAVKNGLPIDPVPLPEIGEGGVYWRIAYNKYIIVLAIGIEFLYLFWALKIRHK